MTFPRKIMQLLEGGHWIDLLTRAQSNDGMERIYRRMCNKNPTGAPYGFRIITIHKEITGRLTPAKRPTAKPQTDKARVKEVYPKAKAFLWFGVVWRIHSGLRQSTTMLGRGDTADQAWSDAASRLERK